MTVDCEKPVHDPVRPAGFSAHATAFSSNTGAVGEAPLCLRRKD